MIRLGFLILIALVANMKTIAAVTAHALPPEAVVERIVSPAAARRLQPPDIGAVAPIYPSREPADEDTPSGQMSAGMMATSRPAIGH